MLCTKCQKEATTGKVRRGEFVCDACLKAAKLQKEELVTRYAQKRSREGIVIVSAKYKEGGKYWIRKEFDPGWPHDEREYIGYRRGNAPGYATVEEVVMDIYQSRLSRRDDSIKYLAATEKALEEIVQYCRDNGYTIPAIKEDE